MNDTYHHVQKKHNKMLDLKKLVEFLEKEHGEILIKKVFNTIPFKTKGEYTKDPYNFFTVLKHCKFDVHSRKIVTNYDNNNVDITIDILTNVKSGDTIILLTRHIGIQPIYNHLKKMGVKIILMSCDVPESVKNKVYKVIEIGEELLK